MGEKGPEKPSTHNIEKEGIPKPEISPLEKTRVELAATRDRLKKSKETLDKLNEEHTAPEEPDDSEKSE